MLIFKKLMPGQNQYVITTRKGRHTAEPAGPVRIWRNEIYSILPKDKQLCPFSLTMESIDQISLIVKGDIFYEIQDPVLACQSFDFSSALHGKDSIDNIMLNRVREAIRDTISKLTADEAIMERSKLLSAAVNEKVRPIIDGTSGRTPYGIWIDCSIQQVDYKDQKIKSAKQSLARDRIRRDEETSRIETDEKIKTTEITSKIKLEEEEFTLERNKYNREIEKIDFEKANLEHRLRRENAVRDLEFRHRLEDVDREKKLEEEKIRSEYHLKSIRCREQMTFLVEENEMLSLQKKNEILKNEVDSLVLSREATRQNTMADIEIKKKKLDGIVAISKNVSSTFQGTKLSVYGETSDLMKPLSLLTDLIGEKIQDLSEKEK